MMAAAKKSAVTLETMNFDNRTVRSLPMDPEENNFVRQVPGACFSWVKPSPCKDPKTVSYSSSALKLLDLDETECKRPDFAEYFSGNKILPGSQTAAHCYCGHQFGSFAGQLGDGATMYIGEIINKNDERWEIQFKGAGLTPYSRSADGRKVLRSSIREYLCSEAMHFLGIPTTRAGCCVVSDDKVVRDIFYDGSPIRERCTVILRIAETFLRIGSFEICHPIDGMTGRRGPSYGKPEVLQKLLDYTIANFYSEIDRANSDSQTKCNKFVEELVRRTAHLAAMWQCVGFCHGVLNTDNTSIIGVTIDYGPFGFMDRFNPDYICNNSDDGGRYSYKNQPEMLKWNLGKLVEALKDISSTEQLLPLVDSFDVEYESKYMEIMRKKLGLLINQESDKTLVEEFLDTMHKTSADFTNSFRCLSSLESLSEAETEKLVSKLVGFCCSVEELAELSKPQFNAQELANWSILMRMMNYSDQATNAIMKEMDKSKEYLRIKKMKPEEKMESDRKLWTNWVKSYVERLKNELKEQVSADEWHSSRIAIMNSNNPRFILRNYIAQQAIDAAEKDDFSEVNKLLKLLSRPYGDDFPEKPTHHETKSSNSCHVASNKAYTAPPPLWAYSLKVT